MYRLLAARHGGVRERRDQLTHPAYARPELLAERPNEVWSWDISKLKGPAKWTCFHLYVILDVFSRYAVGWTVQQRESAELATALIGQAVDQQQIEPRPADRARRPRHRDAQQAGRVPARRPRRPEDAQPALHLDRQPLQRGAVQDAQVPARVPRPVRLDRARPRVLPHVLRLVQPPAPPLRDRSDDPGRRPPRPGDANSTPNAPASSKPPTRQRRSGSSVGRPRHPNYRPPPGSTSPTTRGGCSLNSTTECLIRLDRLRRPCVRLRR